MISDDVLQGSIDRLKALAPTFHAPADGKGIYLGDGIPHKEGIPLRSNVLLQLLEELKRLRWENSSPTEGLGGYHDFGKSKAPIQGIEWCGLCEKETPQIIYCSDHERDSSGDRRQCLECQGTWSGYTDTWEPAI